MRFKTSSSHCPRKTAIYDYESFEWDNDEAFFAYMDRLGMSGVLYSIIGLFIMFDSLNLESMAYLLTTVYLVILGIQGFSEEADARWRRGVGGYGAILTAFLFANSLDSDLFSAIATVMSGMVALGFGFLFMQRMNEDDGIYQEVAAEAPNGLNGRKGRSHSKLSQHLSNQHSKRRCWTTRWLTSKTRTTSWTSMMRTMTSWTSTTKRTN